MKPSNQRNACVPDHEVITRILNGEKELYRILIQRHNQKLVRVMKSYLRNETEVEDALQETYLKAFEKLCQFHCNAQFSTWLIRIGINTALGVIKNKKQFTFSFFTEEYIHKNIQGGEELISASPEAIFIRHEANNLLIQAIDSIPEKYKIIYNLREVEGMTQEEVMKCLAISESNVKIRLFRAKNFLRARLVGCLYNSGFSN